MIQVLNYFITILKKLQEPSKNCVGLFCNAKKAVAILNPKRKRS